jgi:hypothetical protein
VPSPLTPAPAAPLANPSLLSVNGFVFGAGYTTTDFGLLPPVAFGSTYTEFGRDCIGEFSKKQYPQKHFILSAIL